MPLRALGPFLPGTAGGTLQAARSLGNARPPLRSGVSLHRRPGQRRWGRWRERGWAVADPFLRERGLGGEVFELVHLLQPAAGFVELRHARRDSRAECV